MRLVDAGARTASGSPGRQVAVATINAAQAAYTSRVEAVVRAARIPSTIQGMGQAILSSLAQLQSTTEGVLDVLRY